MTQAAMPTEEGREEGEEGEGRVEVAAHSLVMCVWSHSSGEPVDIGHLCGVVG